MSTPEWNLLTGTKRKSVLIVQPIPSPLQWLLLCLYGTLCVLSLFVTGLLSCLSHPVPDLSEHTCSDRDRRQPSRHALDGRDFYNRPSIFFLSPYFQLSVSIPCQITLPPVETVNRRCAARLQQPLQRYIHSIALAPLFRLYHQGMKAQSEPHCY